MELYEIIDAQTVRPQTGTEISVVEAIRVLPWVHQLCPLMPHQYAVLRKSPGWAWFALDAMIRLSSDSYLAYFRGYAHPNRYWDAPDGLRYWRTRFELNRCTQDSVEPPRRVDQGASPIPVWNAPPWAPNGSDLYEQDSDGRWWPRFDGTELKPCRGCRRVVADGGVVREIWSNRFGRRARCQIDWPTALRRSSTVRI
jgi:hypothetical protein